MWILNTILSFFILTVATDVMAQNSVDQVKMTNGKIFTGQIIEQKPGEYIKIVTTKMYDTLTILMEEIETLRKIESDNKNSSDKIILKNEPKFNKRLYSIAFGASASAGASSTIPGEVGFGFGFNVYRHVTRALLIGANINLYTADNDKDFLFFPIAVAGQYTLQEIGSGRLSYLLTGSLGYSNPNGKLEFWNSREKVYFEVGGGTWAKIGLGFRLNALKNSGLLIDIGYHYHSAKLSVRDDLENISTGSWKRLYIQGSIFF